MRKILAILLFFTISLNALAQVDRPRNLPAFDYKKLHWGFTVGLNSMDFSLVRNNSTVYADVIGFQPAGFQVNIVSDLRLNESMNLRFLPGINLGSRKFVYYDMTDSNNPSIVESMTIGSSYLDFPVILKYRAERVNNYRPYVIGGMSFRYDMSARKEFAPDQDDRILLKKANPFLEFGFGIDSYLQFFKFSTEVKVAIGLRNMLNEMPFPGEEQYTESLRSLRPFMLMLNWHFE